MSNFKLQPVNENGFTTFSSHERGFTLIEFLLVSAIVSILVGLSTVNLFSFQHKSQLDSTVVTFITDMKEMQTKAMVGDTEGRTTNSPYGVHVNSNQYILFHGVSYNVADSTNFSRAIPNTIQFTSSNYNVFFASGSGELTGASSVALRDTVTGAQKTIQMNKYGIITGINNF